MPCLEGSLDLSSNNILVDEFMTTAETEEVSVTDTTSDEWMRTMIWPYLLILTSR